ncbi:MAG: TonB-dependent receptor [Bacteroidetes bacterium]|nr:TonB-dependent receptor [Bacteroidota bacterium]
MNKKILITGLLLFICVFAFGQEKVQDTVRQENLNEVVITANRLPFPIKLNPGATTVVMPTVLSVMPRSIAVDEALRLVPGVRIDNQANGSRVHMSIRGQGILSERGLRGIKVLIDGIPVNDPTGFAPDFYDVDWATVQNIEVLRGPSASLYGGSSNAGVLNISTENGSDKPIQGNVQATFGSNGFYKILGQASGTKNDLNYRISISHIKGNGYRNHQAFRGTNFSEKVTWKPNERLKLTQMLYVTDYFNQNAEGLNLAQLDDPKQANPDAIPFNEYQKTNRITNGLTGEVKITGNQYIHFNGYLRLTDYKEPGSSAVQYRYYNTSGASVQYNLTNGENKIINHFSTGIDFAYQFIHEYKVPNIKDPTRTEEMGKISETVIEDTIMLANQDIRQNAIGAFIVDRLELGRKLNAIISVRFDKMENELTDKMNRGVKLSGNADFKKPTARIGLSYALSPLVNLYTNWGQGFLPPATEELASNPLSYGGFNQDMVPATSIGEEIGIRGYKDDNFYYDITAFILNTDNDFYRYRIPDRPLETFYGNAGSSQRFGVETYVKYSPFKPLLIQAAYTYSHFKYTAPDSISGNWLPNSPQHQLYAGIEVNFLKNFSFGISTEFQSKWYIYTDVVNKDVNQAGFNLYHARLAYHFIIGTLDGELSIYGRNLTNADYMGFTEPDPGGNSYQPGPGREVFGSVKLQF